MLSNNKCLILLQKYQRFCKATNQTFNQYSTDFQHASLNQFRNAIIDFLEEVERNIDSIDLKTIKILYSLKKNFEICVVSRILYQQNCVTLKNSTYSSRAAHVNAIQQFGRMWNASIFVVNVLETITDIEITEATKKLIDEKKVDEDDFEDTSFNYTMNADDIREQERLEAAIEMTENSPIKKAITPVKKAFKRASKVVGRTLFSQDEAVMEQARELNARAEMVYNPLEIIKTTLKQMDDGIEKNIAFFRLDYEYFTWKQYPDLILNIFKFKKLMASVENNQLLINEILLGANFIFKWVDTRRVTRSNKERFDEYMDRIFLMLHEHLHKNAKLLLSTGLVDIDKLYFFTDVDRSYISDDMVHSSKYARANTFNFEGACYANDISSLDFFHVNDMNEKPVFQSRAAVFFPRHYHDPDWDIRFLNEEDINLLSLIFLNMFDAEHPLLYNRLGRLRELDLKVRLNGGYRNLQTVYDREVRLNSTTSSQTLISIEMNMFGFPPVASYNLGMNATVISRFIYLSSASAQKKKKPMILLPCLVCIETDISSQFVLRMKSKDQDVYTQNSLIHIPSVSPIKLKAIFEGVEPKLESKLNFDLLEIYE